jgi:hypothetical protein
MILIPLHLGHLIITIYLLSPSLILKSLPACLKLNSLLQYGYLTIHSYELSYIKFLKTYIILKCLLTSCSRLYPNYKFRSLTLTTYTLIIIEHAIAFKTFHSFNIIKFKFPCLAKFEFTFIVTIWALNH